MAMVLMNQLNYDVCDMINKVAMKSYREDRMWKYFVSIISGGEDYDEFDNFVGIKKRNWAKMAEVIIYDVYDTKQKKDSLCKVFWYILMNTLQEYEWGAYGEMFVSNKDKMFNIIDKYFVVNGYEEIVPTNENIKNLIKDKTLKFKKNGDVDKRCKAWKKYGNKPVMYYHRRHMERKILDDGCNEDFKFYEIPEEEWNDQWVWR